MRSCVRHAVYTIYQGDLLHKLALVVQNGQCCDKETRQTNSPAVQDTAAVATRKKAEMAK